MHPADIKAALQKRGVKQRHIAAECSVSDETVSSVIYGRTKSTRIARVIARRTGIPVTKLWPGRYDNSNHEAA